MGNLPNTKATDHSATKAPVNVSKQNHPEKTRGGDAGANKPSGGSR